MEFKDAVAQNIWRVVNDHGFVWESIWSTFLVKSYLAATARYLSGVKGDVPQAAVLKDGDKVLFGALVEKQENKDANGFTLTYFFGDKKLPEDTKIVSTEDPVLAAQIRTECLERFHMFFRPIDGNDYVTKILGFVINCITDFFKVNLNGDPHITLDMKNFFKIEGVMVDDKVELIFTPEETLKQIIKDDAKNAVDTEVESVETETKEAA